MLSFFNRQKSVDFNKEKITSLSQKARYAEELLNNPLFNEIFQSIQDEILTAWRNSNASDKEFREVLFMRMEAIRKFELILKNYIAEAIYQNKEG